LKIVIVAQKDNKPIELWSYKVTDEKNDYFHNNQVEEGFVFRPEDYIYSSAADYAGENGMLDILIKSHLRKVRVHCFSTLLPLTPKGELAENQ
jgi:hypothetical protein